MSSDMLIELGPLDYCTHITQQTLSMSMLTPTLQDVLTPEDQPWLHFSIQ